MKDGRNNKEVKRLPIDNWYKRREEVRQHGK